MCEFFLLLKKVDSENQRGNLKKELFGNGYEKNKKPSGRISFTNKTKISGRLTRTRRGECPCWRGAGAVALPEGVLEGLLLEV